MLRVKKSLLIHSLELYFIEIFRSVHGGELGIISDHTLLTDLLELEEQNIGLVVIIVIFYKRK